MQFEELRYVCKEAAIDLLSEQGRPLPPMLVLPRPERTRLLTIPGLPDDDRARHDVMAEIAHEELTAKQIPAWGFVAEAEVGGEDAAVVVYGARGHAPEITAARFGEEGGLVEFVDEEELDPTAMPFLHPLQHAVDALPAVEQPPDDGGEGLPLLQQLAEDGEPPTDGAGDPGGAHSGS